MFDPSMKSSIFWNFFPSLCISRIFIDSLFPQAISNLLDNTSPTWPAPFPNSALKILYLSPPKLKKAPGTGNNPLILPIIFNAFSFQLIWPSDFLILLA